MAAPTGTFQTYAAVGIREDLTDVITDISPMERPFMSNVRRATATNTFHEWQTDALAAASSANAVIEGDDATTDTATPTVRFGNYCQIMDKVPRVAGTQRAVNTAGRRDEMSYQVAKRGRELLRDVERRLCSDQAATAGAAAGAREMAGIGAWLWDNQVKTGDANTTVTVTSGAPTTDPTSATTATFTEANLKAAIEACWNDGGDPNLVLVGSHNKQLASAFGGIATQYRENPQVGPGVIIAAADIYVSDFGQHNIVATRFSENASQTPLAKTGDSDRRQIITEVTLEACEPKANAKVFTTTTS
jgi:hypothetical protein